jgi:hypothetical protein
MDDLNVAVRAAPWHDGETRGAGDLLLNLIVTG